VVSTRGKEAVIAILEAQAFFGEGCLARQPRRIATATALTDCSLMRIEKSAPQTNDLVLQLRKHGISQVILGEMWANMRVESHLRDLREQGFEVAVAKDATAAPRHPE
jgi:nicotinamidase-related amidase